MMEDAPTLDAPTTAPILPSPSQIQQVANHYESVIGWLEIPGVLRYPVVQAADNTFFLTHDFQGRSSACGSIFMDFQNDCTPLNQNTVLYGHNMGRASNLMFSQLTRYKSLSFWRSHPTLTFDTADQSYGTWTIFAVCHLPASQASSFFAKEFVSRAAFTSFVREAQQNPFMIRVYRRPKTADCLRWSHATAAGMEKRDGCSFLHFVLLNCEIQKKGCPMFYLSKGVPLSAHGDTITVGCIGQIHTLTGGNIAALALRMSQGEPQRAAQLGYADTKRVG